MRNVINKCAKYISLMLVAVFVSFNVLVVTANAAAPVIELAYPDEETLDLRGKTGVSDLQIICLEEPRAGKLLDTVATVKTNEGLFWNVPVIWVDEEGQISSICIPGKKYTPVLAFFIPNDVFIVHPIGEKNYTLRLPEYLNDVYGENNILSVANPSTGLTYITSSELVDTITPDAERSILNSEESRRVTELTKISNSFDYEEVQRKLEESIREQEEQRRREEEEAAARKAAQRAKEQEETEEDELVKLVPIHCSESVIENIGTENLSSLIDLIYNVIEPQAVYQLSNGFVSYGQAVKDGEIGENIGLYIYDSRYVSDKKKDDDNALAYVKADSMEKDNPELFGYYIGVNTETLYTKNDDGTYTFNEDQLETFKNTITHEMMHAFMDDYTRTGMMGYTYEGSQYENTDEGNSFPAWFQEGTASTVDRIYSYRNEIFNNMHVDKNDALSEYTVQSLLNYYYNYDGGEEGKPSIDSTNKYYNSENNTASAYVSGYLACLYLADLAVQKGYVNNLTTTTTTLKDGSIAYDNDSIKSGLDAILYNLHKGYSLDEIINDISNGQYTSTEDFQNKFLSGTYNEETNEYEGIDSSAEFCVQFLNYLNSVSKDLTGDAEYVAFANGSILLPFDTDKESAIEDKIPDDMPAQKVFKLVGECDLVKSTVKAEDTWKTAGTHETAVAPEGESEEPISGATSMAADRGVTGSDSTAVDGEYYSKYSEPDENAEAAAATEESAEDATNVSEDAETDAETDVETDAETDASKVFNTTNTGSGTENSTTSETSDTSEAVETTKATDTSEPVETTALSTDIAETSDVSNTAETADESDEQTTTVPEAAPAEITVTETPDTSDITQTLEDSSNETTDEVKEMIESGNEEKETIQAETEENGEKEDESAANKESAAENEESSENEDEDKNKDENEDEGSADEKESDPDEDSESDEKEEESEQLQPVQQTDGEQ